MNAVARALQAREAGLKACTTVALVFITAAGGGSRPAVTPGAQPSAAVLRLQRDLDAIVTAPALQHSTWGVSVKSLTRDETLYALNAHRLLLPASSMKVVTLAAAAERLGWDFTFETRLVALGPVDGGVLHGDLFVVGTGDPSIDDWDGAATRLFRGWGEELKARGITTISGRIVGHDNAFADQALGSGWAWDDLDKSFATAVGALQFNENTARLTVAPGAAAGEAASASVAPPGSGLVVHNLVRTSGPDVPADIETRRLAGSAVLEVRGSIPVGAMPFIRTVSAYNPTLYFVTALREALIGNAVAVRGEAIDVDDVADVSGPPSLDRGAVLVSHRSPPLSTLAVTMMKVSQNLFAESLLNAIGGPGAVRSMLPRWGVPDSSLVVADGSGLSRYNLATPDAFVTILTHVYREAGSRDLFEATLPVAGRDGTLAQRMNGTTADGNARAKTGAFSNARALSGYVRTRDGEPLVFSVMANNFGTTPDVVEKTTDAIIVKLAEFSRR
jgi:D-alanyl-D-alanine carboxypeptidase/D-alanyl-D-alanine-endopeptidase (penicillin-binding protein 4)